MSLPLDTIGGLRGSEEFSEFADTADDFLLLVFLNLYAVSGVLRVVSLQNGLMVWLRC